jgi:hypothetical protein
LPSLSTKPKTVFVPPISIPTASLFFAILLLLNLLRL